MGNVVPFKKGHEGFGIVYYLDEDQNVYGVGCEGWPFLIRKNDDGKQIALVDEATGEPFGILDRDVFNTVLMCWLLIDDPELFDKAKEH